MATVQDYAGGQLGKSNAVLHVVHASVKGAVIVQICRSMNCEHCLVLQLAVPDKMSDEVAAQFWVSSVPELPSTGSALAFA